MRFWYGVKKLIVTYFSGRFYSQFVRLPLSYYVTNLTKLSSEKNNGVQEKWKVINMFSTETR